MGHIYMFNLSKTTLVIIFPPLLVMVVAPKAFNFGNFANLVSIEIRCGGDLQWPPAARPHPTTLHPKFKHNQAPKLNSEKCI
jgi:hypothetical protein